MGVRRAEACPKTLFLFLRFDVVLYPHYYDSLLIERHSRASITKDEYTILSSLWRSCRSRLQTAAQCMQGTLRPNAFLLGVEAVGPRLSTISIDILASSSSPRPQLFAASSYHRPSSFLRPILRVAAPSNHERGKRAGVAYRQP